jgi:NTE family protein
VAPFHAAGAFKEITALFAKQYSDPVERLRAICDLAVNATTIPWAQRRADVVQRLGLSLEMWPPTPMAITAIDVETRSLRTFDRDSGVGIVDAVAAGTAVPGIWPLAPIEGRRYIDGGVWRTAENAHLANGAPSVLILSPFGRNQAERIGGGLTLDDDIVRLRAGGSRVVLITADQAARATPQGSSPLDPATRKPGAEAGRIQGRKEAVSLAAFLRN